MRSMHAPRGELGYRDTRRRLSERRLPICGERWIPRFDPAQQHCVWPSHEAWDDALSAGDPNVIEEPPGIRAPQLRCREAKDEAGFLRARWASRARRRQLEYSRRPARNRTEGPFEKRAGIRDAISSPLERDCSERRASGNRGSAMAQGSDFATVNAPAGDSGTR